MQMHDAKRVSIIIEARMERRLTDILDASGVTGYTILPVHGGSGRSGRWSRDGAISDAEGMVQVVCIVRPDRTEALLESIFKVVNRHIGVVTVGDCQVLRAERF